MSYKIILITILYSEFVCYIVGKYVFPSVRSNQTPMSNNTINAAFRRMGYTKEEITAHGFRSTASSLLNERGYNPDAIEAQLSHINNDVVRAAYNRSQYWDERITMMQYWADYLDELRLRLFNQ